MKYIATIFTFLCISGCFSLQETKHIDLNNMSGLNNTNYQTGSVQEDTKKDIYITGSIDSGVNISGQYISIISSGNSILYDQTFKLDTPNFLTRNYSLSYSPISTYPIIRFTIFKTNSSITLTHFSLTDTQTNNNIQQSNKDMCTPSYEEGINYKPKTHTLRQGDQTYYLTYALFDITAPDTMPSKDYQSEICFIKNDKYTILPSAIQLTIEKIS